MWYCGTCVSRFGSGLRTLLVLWSVDLFAMRGDITYSVSLTYFYVALPTTSFYLSFDEEKGKIKGPRIGIRGSHSFPLAHRKGAVSTPRSRPGLRVVCGMLLHNRRHLPIPAWFGLGLAGRVGYSCQVCR
ncbi:hypothetical protein V8F20_007610 [Naviculisporaceae sp. PSN 640]